MQNIINFPIKSDKVRLMQTEYLYILRLFIRLVVRVYFRI